MGSIPTPEAPVDAVVIGAGLSGLSAARTLVKHGKTVVVLEARNRVGGKVFDHEINICRNTTARLEAGAAYIGPGQTAVHALCKELGLETFKTYNEGRGVVCLGHDRLVCDFRQTDDIGAHVPAELLMQIAHAEQQLDAMAHQLDIAAPWAHPQATVWDSMTLASWLDQTFSDEIARELITIAFRSTLSAEPADVSLLQALVYIARAVDGNKPGAWDRLTSVAGGAQEERIKGGPNQLAAKMAEQLGPHRVLLNSPVYKITRDDGDDGIYSVYSESEKTNTRTMIRGWSVIMALSPPLLNRICYDPLLPAARDQMCQRMAMGSLGKVYAIYKTPFWRQDGLNGQAIAPASVATHATTVQCTFDASPPDASFGALMGFLEAGTMRTLDDKTEEQIQSLVLKDFVRFFGPRAAEVEGWFIQRWDNEEFSRGAHFALCPPGVITQYGPSMTDPVGNMFFAGTEMSPTWSGFMEGAIVSGVIAGSAAAKRLG